MQLQCSNLVSIFINISRANEIYHSHNSQENTFARVSYVTVSLCLRPITLLKRDSGTGVFL